MPRPKAAQRVAASNVAASLAALLSPARASRNALKHGLCAEAHVVVEGESPEAFAAFEAALIADLAPAGALQTLLAGRIARAAWRLERAERIEAELFAREMDLPFGEADLGLALIRDGNGARAFDTLLRYRGAAQAELFRTLRTLKALQAEAPPARELPAASSSPPELPIEPNARGNPGDSPRAPAPARPAALAVPAETAACAWPRGPAPRQGTAPSFPADNSLLAGTALVPSADTTGTNAGGGGSRR
jgi:hypothetical protein